MRRRRRGQNTYISKLDWQIDNNGKHQVFLARKTCKTIGVTVYRISGTGAELGEPEQTARLRGRYTATLRPNLVSYGAIWPDEVWHGEHGRIVGRVMFPSATLSTIYPTTTASVRIIPAHTLCETLPGHTVRTKSRSAP